MLMQIYPRQDWIRSLQLKGLYNKSSLHDGGGGSGKPLTVNYDLMASFY